MALRFDTFGSNEEFVNWQTENSGLPIYQMTPVAGEFGIRVGDENANGAITFGLFVVYGDTPEQK